MRKKSKIDHLRSAQNKNHVSFFKKKSERLCDAPIDYMQNKQAARNDVRSKLTITYIVRKNRKEFTPWLASTRLGLTRERLTCVDD